MTVPAYSEHETYESPSVARHTITQPLARNILVWQSQAPTLVHRLRKRQFEHLNHYAHHRSACAPSHPDQSDAPAQIEIHIRPKLIRPAQSILRTQRITRSGTQIVDHDHDARAGVTERRTICVGQADELPACAAGGARAKIAISLGGGAV